MTQGLVIGVRPNLFLLRLDHRSEEKLETLLSLMMCSLQERCTCIFYLITLIGCYVSAVGKHFGGSLGRAQHIAFSVFDIL